MSVVNEAVGMQELPRDAALLPAVHVVLLRRAALGLFRRHAATHLLPSAAALLRAPPPPWPWLPAALGAGALRGALRGAAAEVTDQEEEPPPIAPTVSSEVARLGWVMFVKKAKYPNRNILQKYRFHIESDVIMSLKPMCERLLMSYRRRFYITFLLG